MPTRFALRFSARAHVACHHRRKLLAPAAHLARRPGVNCSVFPKGRAPRMGSHPASERRGLPRPLLALRSSLLGTSRSGRAGGIACGHANLRFAGLARREAPPCVRTQKAALRAWVLIPPASIGDCPGFGWHFGLSLLELHEVVGLAGFEPTKRSSSFHSFAWLCNPYTFNGSRP